MKFNADLSKAMKGDINAFHSLFNEFKPELKSFLYRLLTDRNLVDDFYHDTFIKAFDKIKTYQGKSNFKTWCFTIASNLSIDYLRKQKRWSIQNNDKSKTLAINTPSVGQAFINCNTTSPTGSFEIREHIDFCFTCMSKTLEIEKQIAVILKDIYHFEVKEIAIIMDYSSSNIKKLLLEGRKTLTTIFDKKCALVNKNGTCHQCSELNGFFNQSQNQQAELMKIKMVKNLKKGNKEELYKMRTELVQAINPLNANGTDLHEIFMDVTRVAEKEIKKSSFFTINNYN